MSPSCRPLSGNEAAARDAGLDLAAQLIIATPPLGIDQVQALYNMLVANWDGGDAAIAVGLAFGDQIARKAGFEWVRVSDEYGDETCVAPPGKDIWCAPISMLQKRLQRREAVDLARLRDDMIQTILERVDQDLVADR